MSINHLMSLHLNMLGSGDRQMVIGTDLIFPFMEQNIGYILVLCITKKILCFLDGRVALFGLYRKSECNTDPQYVLLGEYADMHDLLESRVIEGIPFSDVIMDDYTELLGQD